MKRFDFINVLFAIFFIFSAAQLSGQVCTATVSNNWATAFPGYPGSCTSYVILTGVTVTIPDNTTITVSNGFITINNGGTLDINNNAILNLTNTPLTINTGGGLTPQNNSQITNGSITYSGIADFATILAVNGLQANGALPIELLSFIGKRVGNTVQLQWKTATETNNALMEVERSRDGIQFEKIGAEKARGDGNSLELQTYNFIDAEPLPGANYYRLRQVDKDNKDEYHKIITVLFTDAKSDDIKVFPTIVREELNIALSKETETDGQLYIHNAAGQLVWRGTFERGMQQRTLPLQELPQGQYFITLQTSRVLQTARFVKM